MENPEMSVGSFHVTVCKRQIGTGKQCTENTSKEDKVEKKIMD